MFGTAFVNRGVKPRRDKPKRPKMRRDNNRVVLHRDFNEWRKDIRFSRTKRSVVKIVLQTAYLPTKPKENFSESVYSAYRRTRRYVLENNRSVDFD